jgi:hypothetical protein
MDSLAEIVVEDREKEESYQKTIATINVDE